MVRYTDVVDKTIELPYSLRYFKTGEGGKLESGKRYSVLVGKFNLFRLFKFLLAMCNMHWLIQRINSLTQLEMFLTSVCF